MVPETLTRYAVIAAEGDRYVTWRCRCQASILENSPGWGMITTKLAPFESRRAAGSPFWSSCVQQVKAWAGVVAQADEGALLALLDADTIVLRNLDFAFLDPFDVGYTVRGGKIPLNAGALYLRGGRRAREFMWAWAKRADDLLCRPAPDDKLAIRQYITPDQAALAQTVQEFMSSDTVLARMACARFNCEQESWRSFSPETVVVHVKNRLRDVLENPGERIHPEELAILAPIIRECRRYGWGENPETVHV